MMKPLYIVLTVLVLTSCAHSYNITGTSNVPTLDGRMLYLKIFSDNNLHNVDSCDIIHGQFSFSGTADSAQMATIFMDDSYIMPVVLESGDITINIEHTQQTASGTPLNEKLLDFFNRYNQIKSLQAELVHRHDQAIMDGLDMSVINSTLMKEDAEAAKKEDELITRFVCDNFDNVLGPGVFFMITSLYDFPTLTPWIEYIMSKATPYFKNDPYVKAYYKKAQENEQYLNGMKDIPQTGNYEPDNR